MKQVYESVLVGAQILKKLFNFVDTPTPEEATAYFAEHAELADTEVVEQLFDQQMMDAVHDGDTERYRRLSDRCDLWRNLTQFDNEEGLRQHMLFLALKRDDKTIQAEMGIMLLAEAKEPDEYHDIIGRFPSVASQEGLAMATQMVMTLSNHGATEQYDRYVELQRLIERCLEVGVDRALAQLK